MKNNNNQMIKYYQIGKNEIDKLEFDCGDEKLNKFLLEDSKLNMENNLCILFICLYNEELIGYFSLSAASVKVNNDLQVKYNSYPAIKIGRMAIHKNFQGKGFGTIIFNFIRDYSKILQKRLGIRFLSVDSYNDKKNLNFYLKNKFEILEKKQYKTTVPMFFDLDEKR